TREADQGHDLNGDNDATDLIVQEYDACTGVVTALGAVDENSSDPLDAPGQTGVFVAPAGRCYNGGTLLLVPATCAADTDCPGSRVCRNEPVAVAPGTPGQHDAVVLPRKAVNVLLSDSTEVVKKIAIKVRNADILPVKEIPGHVVQLSVDLGN